MSAKSTKASKKVAKKVEKKVAKKVPKRGTAKAEKDAVKIDSSEAIKQAVHRDRVNRVQRAEKAIGEILQKERCKLDATVILKAGMVMPKVTVEPVD